MARFTGLTAPLRRIQQHWAGRAAIGAGLTVLTVLMLSQWANAVAQRYPFFCLYPPILVSSWLGTTAGGSTATVIGALAIHRLWLSDGGVTGIDYAALAIFAVTGIAIAAVQGRLKQTRDDLRASLAREAEANRMKDDFLATLSHELRTPLNVILGYSRMLAAKPCANACAEAARMGRGVAMIERNAVAQMRIVEDLLDIQRIVAGRFKIEYGPCDLDQITRTVIDSLLPGADAKRLRVQTSIEPMVIDADAARIQQVIWNLLGNAIKFSREEGCIDLQITRRHAEAHILVKDEGAGIPGSFLPHVFERFRQLDMSTTRRHQGMGLGLAIVKHIVEAHGGTVAAESPGEGMGATFRLRLPVARSAQSTVAPAAFPSD